MTKKKKSLDDLPRDESDVRLPGFFDDFGGSGITVFPDSWADSREKEEADTKAGAGEAAGAATQAESPKNEK